jgi:hypothetical protein
MDSDWKLKLNKCVIVISKKGKPYHYFRPCKTITKSGLYCVETFDEISEDLTKININYQAIWNGKEIEIFDDIVIAIETLKNQKLRDWKINNLLK